MSRVLAISPHLDDAVFSAGGTLAEHAMAGDEVTVLTCFTGNVPEPTGFALACQLDKGLAPDIDYMALRRDEDHDACAKIGATALHWPFLEAP
ncbi:MAG: PIG-L family deacetylase, partial [Erythrobacter sp.]|nr:PIG-L family deacetylase [Erythrobacter sp.]